MNFDTHVSQMKGLANHLVKFSFPLVSPVEEEVISCLKQREINIDGYDLIIYFNKCNYNDSGVTLETVQIFGKYFTFLPFSIVFKIARRFLGDNKLCFVEIMNFQGGVEEITRKIYVWTVYYGEDGERMFNPHIKDFTIKTYDGVDFCHAGQNQLSFF